MSAVKKALGKKRKASTAVVNVPKKRRVGTICDGDGDDDHGKDGDDGNKECRACYETRTARRVHGYCDACLAVEANPESLCTTSKCTFVGNASTDGMCSKCFRLASVGNDLRTREQVTSEARAEVQKIKSRMDRARGNLEAVLISESPKQFDAFCKIVSARIALDEMICAADGTEFQSIAYADLHALIGKRRFTALQARALCRLLVKANDVTTTTASRTVGVRSLCYSRCADYWNLGKTPGTTEAVYHSGGVPRPEPFTVVVAPRVYGPHAPNDGPW